MKILFVDSVAYKPYTLDTLKNEALGGTEATVLRIAEGLAKRGHDVSLYQKQADDNEMAYVGAIRHVGLYSMFPIPDVVVHLRTGSEVELWKTLYPKASHYVWLHDLAGEWCKEDDLRYKDIICVSNYHKRNIEQTFRELGITSGSIHVLHNPVEASTPFKFKAGTHRAGFFSSPHKGLEQVLKTYNLAKEAGIIDELVIGNPGYIEGKPIEGKDITVLGSLTHDAAMRELAMCSVLLYNQRTFPETFGLILAEAEALGVKVLAYDFGAASEVLKQNTPLSCSTQEEWLVALKELLEEPDHKPMNSYPLEGIVQRWEEVLNE
jgi:glycosyltransferase involved in cell wall biosynthesis